MSQLDELEKHLKHFPRRGPTSPESRVPSVSYQVAGARPTSTLRGPRALPGNFEDDDELSNSMQSVDISDRVSKLREAVGTVPTRKRAPPPQMPSKSATVGRQSTRPNDPFEYALNRPYSNSHSGHTAEMGSREPPPIPRKPVFDSKTEISHSSTAPPVPPAPVISTYASDPRNPVIPKVSAPTPTISAPAPTISTPAISIGPPLPTISSPSQLAENPTTEKPSSTNERVRVPNPLYMGLRCAECDKPLSGKTITVEPRSWHNECFKCKHCELSLEHIQFNLKDGIPYCALDYEELFSERCAHCKTPIVEKSFFALGKHYHVGHFFCRECGTPFDETSNFMVDENNYPYCEKDYLAKFGVKCFGCKEIIIGEHICALNQKWHKQCFVCTECGSEFKMQKFPMHNNKPYCDDDCLKKAKASSKTTLMQKQRETSA